MPVLRATANVTREVNFKTYYTQAVFTGLYMPGIVHDPLELATLMVHLAQDKRVGRTHQALRFVSTNSNNGWAVCIIAAYFKRVHAPGFHGLAINGLKTEWATVRNVRILLEKLNLSWRSPEAFDAAADAALMTYHPHVRNSLTPTTFAKASTLLPVSWVGLPPPFDVCIRMGMYDLPALIADIAMVGGWCRELIYHGDAASKGPQVAVALTRAHELSGGRSHGATHVGAFTIISSSHLRDASHMEVDGLNTTFMPMANIVPFQFVNKTPPAAPELYNPTCIQDMAGCDWHRGVS